MSNSPLANIIMPAYAGNFSVGRVAKISEITVHHAAGKSTVQSLGNLWQTVGRNGSSHYGVCDNDVGFYVSEGDTAWTNSNWDANSRAVTIETANDSLAPDWHVSDESLNTLIKLVADIAKRNGLGHLAVGKNLTYHSMYTATQCPGPYLFSKLQYIADEANKINEKVDVPPQETLPPEEKPVIPPEQILPPEEKPVTPPEDIPPAEPTPEPPKEDVVVPPSETIPSPPVEIGPPPKPNNIFTLILKFIKWLFNLIIKK